MGRDTEILSVVAGRTGGERLLQSGDALERPTQNKISPHNASSKRRSSSRDSAKFKTTKSIRDSWLIRTMNLGLSEP